VAWGRPPARWACCDDGGSRDRAEKQMADEEFTRALDSSREVDLTVTGRKSGRGITLPVWFARDGGTLYLVPVSGSDSNWYKNVLRTPAIRLAAGGAERTASAAPVTDPARVAEIVDRFRAKYGAKDVAAYYPKQNAAVTVPLG
jgi:deazaflavin-dependent oxidoreductase (nitroreductase family)